MMVGRWASRKYSLVNRLFLVLGFIGFRWGFRIRSILCLDTLWVFFVIRIWSRVRVLSRLFFRRRRIEENEDDRR